MTRAVRVLGVDPGSRLCGWGIVERDGTRLVHVDNGVVVLTDGAPLADRLARLLAALSEVIARHQPTEAAIETVFVQHNARAALILGQARGVALAAMAGAGLAIHEFTPQQIKKAVTGSGRAAKAQVQAMVARRLALPEVPQADAADAVAVALCHAQHGAGAPNAAALPPKAATGRRRRADAALKALVEAQQRAKPPGRSPR